MKGGVEGVGWEAGEEDLGLVSIGGVSLWDGVSE